MRPAVWIGRVAVATSAALLAVAFSARGQSSDYEAARTALRTGRYEDAISTFSRLAEAEPASADAARGLVRALYWVGRYERAERAAGRFIDANPGSPELWGALGRVLQATGRREEAEAAYRRAVEGASDSLTARFRLAVLQYDQGERARAMREFDRFIDIYNRTDRLSSSELTAVAGAVRYLGARDPQLFKDALRAFDEAIAADPGDPEPRIRLGELFLEKYNSADARTTFQDVLKLNPFHPRALLGSARRAHFDGSAEAMELVRRSLDVNRDYVPARVFLAELLIELEDYDEAAVEARRGLRVNPTSLEALAVLAAARHLAGDSAGSHEAQRRARSLNPAYAGTQTTIARLSARNRLYRDAVRFARRAVEIDSTAWDAYALLGINQLRVGALEEGRRNLEIAFAGDPYDVWTKNTLDLLDTFDRYRETRSRRFRYFVGEGESDLLTVYLRELAEEAYDRLAERYGYRPEPPIRVELYRSHADFSVRTVGLAGLGALGVSFGPVLAMDSPGAREIGDFNWGSVFWHELAHTFHLGMTDHRVPRWLSEGLAVFEERRARPGWGDDVTPSFLIALQRGQLLPVGELNSGFMRPSYPGQVGHAYYQASLVCEFIEDRNGFAAIRALLDAYADGLDTPAAFRRALDTDLERFDREFFEHLRTRFAAPLAALRPSERHPTRGEASGDVAARARTRPGDFQAQLAYGRALFEEGDLEAAAERLERAQSLFPGYAGPGSPYWYLALIHRRRGELRRAAAELRALIGINERDYRAHRELAELLEVLDDPGGAADVLERSLYIYPLDRETHERLARLYERVGNHRKLVRERRALLALDPVDRAQALYELARAHYRAGDLPEARRVVLRALERAPNFTDAQELLLTLHESAGER